MCLVELLRPFSAALIAWCPLCVATVPWRKNLCFLVFLCLPRACSWSHICGLPLVFRRPPFGLTLSSVRLLSFLDVFGPPLLPALRFWTSSWVFGPLLASTEVVQQWQDIYVHRRHLLVWYVPDPSEMCGTTVSWVHSEICERVEEHPPFTSAKQRSPWIPGDIWVFFFLRACRPVSVGYECQPLVNWALYSMRGHALRLMLDCHSC